MNKESKSKQMLAGGGFKITKQRMAIINYLNSENMPKTAEQIFLALKNKGQASALSTVYRNLEAMVQKDIVYKTNLANEGRAKFGIKGENHNHHLICLSCSNIVEIKHCPIADLEKTLHKSTDYEVTGHKLEVYGYCPNCKGKR